MLGVSEYNALNYLKEHGINVVPMKLITNIEMGIDFAQEIGYPIVLKANVKNLFHKSELGVVKVNITNPVMLKNEWNNIINILEKHGLKFETMLIQKMKIGIELIIGASIDKQFGPIVMVGSGGIYTEILNDVTFRLTPINLNEALSMVQELKIYSILKGARGQKELDIKEVANTILKVSQIIANDNVCEIDLNPVIISENDVTVVDALIFKKESKI